MLSGREQIQESYDSWKMETNWSIARTESGGFTIKNPAGVTHFLATTPEEWQSLLKENAQTTKRLWLLSLHYIVDVEKIDPEVAITALESLYIVLQSDRKIIASSLSASWDHCVALRLNALALLSASPCPKMALLSLKLIEVEENSEDLWSLITLNNHGFMLAEALLNTALAFEYVKGDKSKNQIRLAESKIREIIKNVFGDDSYSNENSPFYHHFYIVRLKELAQFVARSRSLRDLSEYLTSTASKATETLGNILHNDGSIPNMGDSSEGTTAYKSNLGTHWSTRTGFWVHKTEDLYLSVKCGYDSLTHKHADDTSLTVRFKDTSFITDAGYCNYDYSDPRVLMLRTQLAHSGVFFKSFDDLHPAKLYRGENRLASGLFSASAVSVRGAYTIGGSFIASRIVTVTSERRFVVEDWTASRTGEMPYHRFIVPDEINIEHSEKYVILSSANSSIYINFSRPMHVEVIRAENAPPHRGWISRSPGSVEAAQFLQLQPHQFSQDPVRFTFTISET